MDVCGEWAFVIAIVLVRVLYLYTVAQERKEKIKKTQNGRMFLKKSIFLCCACIGGVKTSLNLIAITVLVYGNNMRIEQKKKNNKNNKKLIYEHELLWLYNFWSIECPKKIEIKLTNKRILYKSCPQKCFSKSSYGK